MANRKNKGLKHDFFFLSNKTQHYPHEGTDYEHTGNSATPYSSTSPLTLMQEVSGMEVLESGTKRAAALTAGTSHHQASEEERRGSLP